MDFIFYVLLIEIINVDLNNVLFKEFQKKRHIYGAFLTFHIFDNINPICFSKTCQPSASILRKLVEACGGKCTTKCTNSILVGSKVSVEWILDSIMHGSMLNIKEYM